MANKLLFLALLAGAAASAATNIEVEKRPRLGVVFDAGSGRLRAVTGIEGGAVVGDPVAEDLSTAAVSPGGSYALAMNHAGALQLLRMDGSPARSLLQAAPDGSHRIELSPAAGSAAIYSSSLHTIYLATGLPDSPSVSDPIAVPISPLSALAVADDGAEALAAFSDGSLYRVTKSGALYAGSVRATTATYFFGRRDAALADSQSGSISLLRGESLSTLLQSGGAPVGLSASSDNQSIFIADAAIPGVSVLNVATTAIQKTPCACQPTTLHRMDGDRLFRLTAGVSQPLWLVNVGTGRMSFVPEEESVRKEPIRTPRTSATDIALTIGVASSLTPGSQTPVSLSTGTAASETIHGELILSASREDEATQFSSGGRHVEFMVPASGTEAIFPGGALFLQTGATPGTLSLKASIDNQELAAVEVPLATAAPIQLTRVRITSTNGQPITLNTSDFVVLIDGTAPGQDVKSVIFHFNPARPGGLQGTDFSPDVSAIMTTFFRAGSTSFEISVPFHVQGSLLDIGDGSVALVDSTGQQSGTLKATPDFVP